MTTAEARAAQCPYCNAPAGEPCTELRPLIGYVHASRVF